MSYRFSIIIPLEYHRGQTLECLRGWTESQKFPQDSYEILAITSSSAASSSLTGEELSEVRKLLRPHDRLLTHDEPHDVALAAYGATQATGELLFFTESHVLPEPNTLELAEAAIRKNPDAAGISARSRAITHNRQSKAEALMYDSDFRFGMEDHPWRKINDQAFVVLKEPYFQAGGFCGEYGHFAEWLLAARMHSLGLKVVYSPDFTVQHYYEGAAATLIEFARDFGRGEILFHSVGTGELCRPLLDPVPEWEERWLQRRDLAVLVWKIVFSNWFKQLLSNPQPGSAKLTKYLLHISSRLVTSNRFFQFQLAHARMLFAKLELAWKLRTSADENVHQLALHELNYACVLFERKKFVLEWLQRQTHRDDDTWPAQWSTEESNSFPHVGIYPGEQWQENSFCWTEQAAAIEMYVEAGLWQLCLEWLPVCNVSNLNLYINGRQVEVNCDDTHAVAEYRTYRAGTVRVGWLCQPFVAEVDARSLGLPLHKISWTRTSSVPESAISQPAIS